MQNKIKIIDLNHVPRSLYCYELKGKEKGIPKISYCKYWKFSSCETKGSCDFFPQKKGSPFLMIKPCNLNNSYENRKCIY